MWRNHEGCKGREQPVSWKQPGQAQVLHQHLQPSRMTLRCHMSGHYQLSWPRCIPYQQSSVFSSPHLLSCCPFLRPPELPTLVLQFGQSRCPVLPLLLVTDQTFGGLYREIVRQTSFSSPTPFSQAGSRHLRAWGWPPVMQRQVRVVYRMGRVCCVWCGRNKRAWVGSEWMQLGYW